MNRKTRLVALTGACLIFVFTLSLGQGPDISGTWTGKAAMTDGSSDEVTVVFKKDGKGYSGTITDKLGHTPAATPIKDVALKQKELKFSFTVSEGFVVSVTVTVDGEKMKGRWDDAQNGESGDVEMARKKT